jgi:dimethylglycine dehydrogenase
MDHLPKDGSVSIHALGQNLVGVSIAGPRSRELLARVCDEDVSGTSLRFMDFRELDVATVPCMINRVSFTGDLGYEIWTEPHYVHCLYDTLMAAGQDLGIRNFGLRALLSLRLEKGFGTLSREFRPLYGPLAAGLERFVKIEKGPFVGRDAAGKELRDGALQTRITLVVDATNADAMGDEAVWFRESGAADRVVGYVTSGGYAHYVDASLAQAYVASDTLLRRGTFEVEILGHRCGARLQIAPIFDPTGARMRM